MTNQIRASKETGGNRTNEMPRKKTCVPHCPFALVAGDAFFVFQSCTVYIPLQFYSVAALKMSLPSWAVEFQSDHTSNAVGKQ